MSRRISPCKWMIGVSPLLYLGISCSVLIGFSHAFQCFSCIGTGRNSCGVCAYKTKEEIKQKVNELLPDVKLEISNGGDANMCIRIIVEKKATRGDEKGSWIIKTGITKNSSNFEGIDIDQAVSTGQENFCMTGKKLEDIAAVTVCGCSTNLCNGGESLFVVKAIMIIMTVFVGW